MATNYPIIDAHQHVFWQGRDDRGLVADMDEHGIASAWLLSWEMTPAEDEAAYHEVLNPLHARGDGTHRGIPLSDLILARDRFPGRFELGYCPHPLLGNAPALLRAAVRMYGVRICGEWKFRLPFDDPRCLELYRAAGEVGLPVVLHLDVPYLIIDGRSTYVPRWYGGTVDNLERALIACPETNFIGHAPGFWREIGGEADTHPGGYPSGPVQAGGRLYRLLDQCPNLYADLSGNSGLGALRRDAEHARQFVTRYSDRLLFGRDIYGGDLQEFMQQLDLSATVRQRLFHDNAAALLAAG